MTDAELKAQEFIDCQKPFHLGVLPTEQSNPKTRGLAEAARRDLPAALAMLQAVDADVAPKAAQVFAGPEFARLVDAMTRTLAAGRRICFSGCGATGRLSILLEASWRRACQDRPEARELEHRALSIMTGGDYALIRSVENFEDFPVFGRRQVTEAGLGPGDLLVAISEGGETSSVIGTIWQALDNGAAAFFAFNNPADVLARHVERSRQVIEDPRVTILDLASGPMAVAGSTRMQATTSELLVAGAALEIAFSRAVGAASPAPLDYAARFEELLQDLARPEALDALAAMVGCEAEIYGHKGLVTYMADECLLDIFTDTTERSPTFMLPRFRAGDDRTSPPPWAFVKNPGLPTVEAWRRVLRRAPRCLEWTAETYVELDAPPALAKNPPRLGAADMLKFMVGNEDDPSRHEAAPSAAILVALDDEAHGSKLGDAFAAAARPFPQRAVLAVGPHAPPAGLAPTVWHVPVRRPASPLRLWDRLAAKLVLNTVSTATMARLGRLVSNWMAHVEPTNKKLIDRGTRLIAELAEVDYKTACTALYETIAELERTVPAGQQRPSPVAVAIARLKDGDRETR